jgi:hypothetical protein
MHFFLLCCNLSNSLLYKLSDLSSALKNMRKQFRVLGQVAVGVHRFKQAGKLFDSKRRAHSVDVGTIASLSAKLAVAEVMGAAKAYVQRESESVNGSCPVDDNQHASNNKDHSEASECGKYGRTTATRSLSFGAVSNVNIEEFLNQMKANDPAVKTTEILGSSLVAGTSPITAASMG